jgi:hypothetical protein
LVPKKKRTHRAAACLSAGVNLCKKTTGAQMCSGRVRTRHADKCVLKKNMRRTSDQENRKQKGKRERKRKGDDPRTKSKATERRKGKEG